MAIGAADESLGLPTMRALRQAVRGCPEPLVLRDVGHFVQDHGAEVAHVAVRAFAEAEARGRNAAALGS